MYAIEKDPAVLKCAKHNTRVYGVENRITWFEGDCFHILKNQLKDLAPYSIVFASPPWGGMSRLLCLPSLLWYSILILELTVNAGPGYRSDKVFNLRTMEPYSLATLYNEYSTFSEHMVLYLPRTSDVRQLAKLVPDDQKVTVMHYCMEGASKALCIFYGGFKVQ